MTTVKLNADEGKSKISRHNYRHFSEHFTDLNAHNSSVVVLTLEQKYAEE